MTERSGRWFAEVSAAATAFLETTNDYDQLISTIARSCAKALHATCMVSLIDDATRTITPVAIHDDDPQVIAAFPLLRRTVSLDATMLRDLDGTDVMFAPRAVVSEVANVSAQTRQFMSDVGVHGYVIVAMRVRGKRIGALTVLRRRADLPPLDDDARDLTIHLAHFAGLAIANAHEFRRAEHTEALRRSEARLLELSQFLDALLDELPTAVFVKEAPDFTFVRVNRASAKLLGRPAADVIGKTIASYVEPDLAAISSEADRGVMASGTLLEQPDIKIQTTDGPRWLNTFKVPIRDAAGVPRWLLGVTHDITAIHEAMAELRRANDAAESANRELEAFSYSVAHDLRTPLRSIDGFSQALLEDYGDQIDETGKNYLERVRAGAQRMAMLIDDLLKLSQVARSELRIEPVDLGELFRSALATHQRLDPDRHVDVVVGDVLRASGDQQLLAIVLANLCGNAWKFTAKCSTARIELGVRDDAGTRVFFVRDNGVGFDMEFADKLFGVFQRLHSNDEFPGTGVGLATVSRIIARHGGTVWADAKVGGGATFSFTLAPS